MSVFSDRLRELRDENNLKSKDLAGQLEITESKLSYYMQSRGDPPFDLLKKVAHRFNVSTDYLTGNSDVRNFQQVEIKKQIQNKSGILIQNQDRKADIEQISVDLYEALVDLSSMGGNSDSWEMVRIWIHGFSLYCDFLHKYKPHQYPMDEAKAAMDNLLKAYQMASEKVGDMVMELLSDEKADKALKNRVRIKQSFRIKDRSEVN